MFTPFFCWLVAAASLRLRIRLYQIIVGVVVVASMFLFLVPYSQLGRNYRDPDASIADNARVAFSLLTNLGAVREQYKSETNESFDLGAKGYYDSPQGFFDRHHDDPSR